MASDVCFWTYASRQYETAYQRMRNSLTKFHPDIPHLRFTEEDLPKMRAEDPIFDLIKMNAYPHFTRLAGRQYRKVIHIDADVLVCSPLTELFEDEYDLAVILDDTATTFNLGLYASTSPAFHELWVKESDENHTKYPDGEQGVFNDVLKRTSFRVKSLDEGAGMYSTHLSYHLKDVQCHATGLFYQDRPIRIIHICARWGSPLKELDFTGEVSEGVLAVIKTLET